MVSKYIYFSIFPVLLVLVLFLFFGYEFLLGEKVIPEYRLEFLGPSQVSGEAVSDDVEVSGDTGSPRVAIVIDDLGWEIETVSLFDQVEVPLTMSILPGRPRSRYLYEHWRGKHEFILHIPMEPLDYPTADPGEFALMTEMSDLKIRDRLQGMLKRYPRVVGANNHMGSAFVRNSDGMKVLMNVLSANGLFYLDSRTGPGSVVPEVAGRNGVPFDESDVFLDGKVELNHVEKQFERLIEVARSRGEAVGIGHIQNPETARVISRLAPEYREEGVDFVFLSELMDLSPFRRQSFLGDRKSIKN